MASEVHVQGQIEPWRLAAFREAVECYRAHAREHGYAEPGVLFRAERQYEHQPPRPHV